MVHTASTTRTDTPNVSSKSGEIALMLRIEGAALFGASVALFGHFSGDWVAFVLLLLVPDLAFLVYLLHRSAGRIAYNLVHTTTAPLILAVAAFLGGWSTVLALALIWLAHIGMDRVVGYGLKYSIENKDTHLQRV